ncbi:unnamed protein product, partial [Mycena citricolor]
CRSWGFFLPNGDAGRTMPNKTRQTLRSRLADRLHTVRERQRIEHYREMALAHVAPDRHCGASESTLRVFIESCEFTAAPNKYELAEPSARHPSPAERHRKGA